MSEEKGFRVDLTNCDREPIHIPGAVQAHGVLAAVGEDYRIRQISENCAEHFGKPPPVLLENSLGELVGEGYFAYLTEEIFPLETEAAPIYLDPLYVNGKTFEVSAHRFQGVSILEFERSPLDNPKADVKLYSVLRARLSEINASKTVREFCQHAAETVRSFTGFDRVMIYRFAEDDSGEVVAEAVSDGMEPFLGLHYPASDIPKQARALYLKQILRFKVDVDEAPARILPVENPQTHAPLDLSYAVTRAMSPIHIEYLKNMGVAASLSISIVKENRLWGLIACHHNAPRYVPHQARMLCEFIAHTISLQIEAKNNAENFEYVSRLKDSGMAVTRDLSDSGNIPHSLINGENNLLTMVEAGGAALVFENKIRLIGTTPDEARVAKIVQWLWKNQTQDVFSTNQISQFIESATDYADEASGVLAARLTSGAPEYVMWFRPEQAREVRWAGNPEKPVQVGEFGDRLQPRKSFEVWREEIRFQSKPWQGFEIEFAESLRRSLVEIILRRTEELRVINAELEQSNAELDSFAYIASHDLKEPLRGINNFTTFLLEDYASRLDEDGISQLKTLIKLSERMEMLLDSLLHYSRVGRLDLQKKEIELQKILDDSLLLLKTRLESENVVVKIAHALPSVLADEIRVVEVFTNLISNAVKYNDNPNKEIEIGYIENIVTDIADTPHVDQVFYVRDNGIGIANRHYLDIFRVFKRLHGRNQYSGGVGVGLTIVKRIVERHGGRIWLESKVGEGTTFYFTLK